MSAKSVALAAALSLVTSVFAEPQRPRFYFPQQIKREIIDTAPPQSQAKPLVQASESTTPNKRWDLDDLLSHIIHEKPAGGPAPDQAKSNNITTIIVQSTVYVLPTDVPSPGPPTGSTASNSEQLTTPTDAAIVVGPTGVQFTRPTDATSAAPTPDAPSSTVPSVPSPSSSSTARDGLGGGLLNPVGSLLNSVAPILQPQPPTSSPAPAPPSSPPPSSPLPSPPSSESSSSSSSSSHGGGLLGGVGSLIDSAVPILGNPTPTAPATLPSSPSSSILASSPSKAPGLLDPVGSLLDSAVPILQPTPAKSASLSSSQSSQSIPSSSSSKAPGLLDPVGSLLNSAVPILQSPPSSDSEPSRTSSLTSGGLVTSAPASQPNATSPEPTDPSGGLILIPVLNPTSLLGITGGSSQTGSGGPLITGLPIPIIPQDPTSLLGITGILPSVTQSGLLPNASLPGLTPTVSLPISSPTSLLVTGLPTAPTDLASSSTTAPGISIGNSTTTQVLTTAPTSAPTGIPVTNGTTSQETKATFATSATLATDTIVPTSSVAQTNIVGNATSSTSVSIVSSQSSTKVATSFVEVSTPATFSTSASSSSTPLTTPPAQLVTSIRPTATLTNTAGWLPSTMIVAPTPTMTFAAPTHSQTPGSSSTALPSGIPKVIAPDDPKPSAPEGTVPIQIGFLYPLNYMFVSSNYVAATQIFSYLPQALADAAGIPVSRILVSRLVPYDTRDAWGYVTTLAQLDYPQDLVNKLQMDIWSPASTLYNFGDDIVRNLTAQINPKIDILGNKTPGLPSNPSNSPAPSNSGTDAFGGSTSADSQSSKQKAATAGIAVGAIGLGAAYGAAMFIVARRYKRKRQAHRRSSSVGNSEASSEMRYAGNGSPALMGGALLSRDMSNYDGVAGVRESHGSGASSAPTGRTANISNPVAAENSLGWN